MKIFNIYIMKKLTSAIYNLYWKIISAIITIFIYCVPHIFYSYPCLEYYDIFYLEHFS